MNIQNRTTLIALTCLLTPFSSWAASSSIQAVEVFPAGASVMREVTLEANADLLVPVELDGLPSSLMASSVQINPLDGSALRIGGFTFLPHENPVKPDDPRTEAEREALKGIDARLRDLRQEREAIESRISHYKGMADSLRRSLSEEADTEAFDLAVKIWSEVELVTRDGQARLADLAETELNLRNQRADAQEALDELVNSLRKTSGVLRFDVRGDVSGGARLTLKYQIREAGWNPVYEIRATPAKGTLEWIYKARIWQQSGEDWSKVTASLKSTSALHATGLPELPPLFLEHMEYRPLARKMMDSVSYAAGAPVEMEEMAQAVPESTTASFFMKLPEALTLASGKGPVVREAFTGSLKAEFWSEAVPQLSTDAWLMAGTENTLGWPILPGEAYSYIDGQLVSRKNLAGIAAGEEIELALGKNEKISIERVERKRKSSEGGLIDKTKRHEIKYETTIANRMPVAHRVVLQDRFPVGRDNKIQVRIQSPKDVEPEEGKGLFKWERTLEAGGKAVLNTEYSVLYPAEWNIHPKP